MDGVLDSRPAARGPPRDTNDDVANRLAHPGVVALPLRDGSPVQTRLLWHSDDGNPIIRSLVDRMDARRSRKRDGA
jgi:hypothetical protein